MTPALLRTRLLGVSAATLQAEGRSGRTRWLRAGSGSVEVVTRRADAIEWIEAGEWTERGVTCGYRTRLRWHFTREGIELSHLRRGPDAPVHLASLHLNEHGALIPRAPHLCGDDQYLAAIRVEAAALTLSWQATGPAKDYRLVTTYR